MDAGVEEEILFLRACRLWMNLTKFVKLMTNAGYELENFPIVQEEKYQWITTGAMTLIPQK